MLAHIGCIDKQQSRSYSVWGGGVQQGLALSPVLFLMVMDPLLHHLEE